MRPKVPFAIPVAVLCASSLAIRADVPLSPSEMTSFLERRIVAGEGVTFPGVELPEPLDPPETICTVYPSVSRVALNRFYILDEFGNPPDNLPDSDDDLAEINQIWRQAGMEFYWGTTTNIAGQENFNELRNEDDGIWDFCSSLTCTNGIRVLFVDRIIPASGSSNLENAVTLGGINGVSYGIAIPSDCETQTFSHEIGHACGLADIYLVAPSSPGNPNPAIWESLDPSDCPSDGTGPTFYAASAFKAETIPKLLMFGFGPIEGRGDISRGRIRGVDSLGGEELQRCGLLDLHRIPHSVNSVWP